MERGLVQSADWVAVDWGTSNVRAWGVDAAGDVVFTAESDRGMGKISQGDYPAVLSGLLEPHGGMPGEVLVCGMAGARQGWKEAGYLETPTDLARLIDGAVAVPGFPARILPGICQRSPEDVMRGEETQLLGLLALKGTYSGPVVMPGTHSKWVRLEEGRVTEFATAITGELYEVLGAHSVLRHSLGGERIGPATEDGVADGLEAGLKDPALLTSLLFRTRAASLLSAKGPDWCSGYLSGLLVGAEIGGRRDRLTGAPLPLIGSLRLARLYAAGLARVGTKSEIIEAADATLAGLKAARQQERTR
jgi:2-dehydro-3-deoxygalactonokinase